MNHLKVIRYFAYILLASIVIWGLIEIFSSYFSIKEEMSFNASMKSHEKEEAKTELKDKNDSMFYSTIYSLINDKKYNNAIAIINQRIKSLPAEKLNLIVDIGDIYKIEGDWQSAWDQYNLAIDSSEYLKMNVYADPKVYGKRGYMSFKMGKLDDAISDLKMAADKNYDYYYELGIVQQKRGYFSDAVASYDSSLHYYPNNMQCKLTRDSLRLKLKQ